MTPPNCPKCGDNRQVWANQITGLMTCHRIDCHTEIEPMTKQTEAQRLATALTHEYSTVDETAAAAELRRLEAESERLRVDAERYRWLLSRIYIDPEQLILRIKDVVVLDVNGTLAEKIDAAIDAAMKEQTP